MHPRQALPFELNEQTPRASPCLSHHPKVWPRASQQTESSVRKNQYANIVVTDLRNGFGLGGLLSLIRFNTLSLDTLSLSILLFIGAEEIDFVIICGSRLSCCCTTSLYECLSRSRWARKGAVFRRVGCDVFVPTRSVRELSAWGFRTKCLEDMDVGLGRSVSIWRGQ